jgi:hypothetical protein
MSVTRDEIRALCAERDQLMEQEAKTLASPPVSETDEAGLVYKDYQGNASQAAATAADEQTDWSGWERWLRAHLDNEREALFDIIGDAMNKMAEQERDAVERQLAELRSENVELKGLLGDLVRKYDELKTRTALAQHL